MFRRTPHRSVSTVLFTDVVNSTDLAAQLGDRRWRALLARHHEAVRGALRRYHGREVDDSGDGFFATFNRPTDAVQCAAAIVGALQAIGLTVRIGIHSGETEVLGSKVAGIAVVIGSRIMAAAGGGEILVSRTVHDLVAGSDVQLESVGPRSLKGVPGEWELFRLLPPAVHAEPDEASHDTSAEARPRRALRRPSRRAGVVIGVGIFALLGGALIAVPALGRPTVAADMVVAFDDNLDAVAAASVRGPELVVYDGESLWVTSPEEGRVLAWFRPDRPADVRTLGGVPLNTLVASHGYVWTTDSFSGGLTKVNPRTGSRDDVISDMPPIRELVSGDDWLWGIRSTGNRLIQIDPDQRATPREIQVDDSDDAALVGLAAGSGRLWVSTASPGGDEIHWMDLSGTEFEERNAFTLRSAVGPIAHDGERLWMLSTEADSVYVADAMPGASPELRDTIEVCDGPSAIATDGQAVWVICRQSREIARIARDGSVTVRSVPATPADVVVVNGRAWITLRAD